MFVKLLIPTPLRQYAGSRDSIDVEAKTVAEALSERTAKRGELRRHLFTDDGKLRSFVNISLNDEDIRHLQRELAPLKDNDTISIVASTAGGMALRCICS